MKSKFRSYLLIVPAYVIAVLSILPLLGNENQLDWFGTELYKNLLMLGWGISYLVLLIIGVLIKNQLFKIPRKKAVKALQIVFVGTFLIVVSGIIKYSIDFNNWQQTSRLNRQEYEKEEEKKFYAVIDSLTQIVQSDSSNSEAFFELGLTHRHNGEWGKSVYFYEIAIGIDSTICRFHSELAYSNSLLKNYDEAIKHFETAYSLDSTKEWIKSEINRCRRMQINSR